MPSNTLLLGLAATLFSPASAYIRFSCGNALVEERADPIVNPGKISGHVHKIAGGNGFGFAMDYNQARSSQCSSCPIKQDMSNYWTPKLYYHAQNGSFISVPTVGDDSRELNGGMTVYYQQRGPDPFNVKAFPAGFKMLAGDPFKRNDTGDFAAKAVSFACLGSNKAETNAIPNYNCPNGLRAQVYFPSCWDGVNLDTPDHKSHMAYPASGSYDNGPCPASHPVQLVSLFFEVLYDTNSFADKWYSSNHPFVFSNGDASGYGFHGDFFNGWDNTTLQQVIGQCHDDSKFGGTDKSACPPLEIFTDEEMNNCRIPPSIDEQVKGVIPVLPGCNPATSGPAYATPPANCTANQGVSIGQPATYYTDVTKSKGWKYLGCGTDVSSGTRTLADKSSMYTAGVGNNMTVEFCMNFCQGYKYAGLEYGSECFCGNALASDRAPKPGILGQCNMKCAGDNGEYCGGGLAMSLYQKCDGSGDCSNAQFSVVGNSTSSSS
jgi:Domain of unknown function (DUF1996)/WSC domain